MRLPFVAGLSTDGEDSNAEFVETAWVKVVVEVVEDGVFDVANAVVEDTASLFVIFRGDSDLVSEIKDESDCLVAMADALEDGLLAVSWTVIFWSGFLDLGKIKIVTKTFWLFR